MITCSKIQQIRREGQQKKGFTNKLCPLFYNKRKTHKIILMLQTMAKIAKGMSG